MFKTLQLELFAVEALAPCHSYDDGRFVHDGHKNMARSFLQYALSDLTQQRGDSAEDLQGSFSLFFDLGERIYLEFWCDAAEVDINHVLKRARQCYDHGCYLSWEECEPVLFGFSRYMLFHQHGRKVLQSKYGFLNEGANLQGRPVASKDLMKCRAYLHGDELNQPQEILEEA